jgi:natural product biosynthesis luciferase-like monooxygenase protein
MQFGLIFFSSRTESAAKGEPYRLLLDSARFADAHGFTSLWVPERHFTPDGWLYPNPSVVAAALARETSSIGLRAGSVVVPLHHPVRIVEEWAVVDQLSGGRVGLSFASGWHPGDFVFFPDRYAERHEHMHQGIELVRALWRGESVTIPGGDGHVTVRTYPPPVQPELPFWITAAGNPQTFELAGILGGHVLTHLFNQSIEELASKIEIYQEARTRHGHSGPGHVTTMVHTFVTDEKAAVDQYARSTFCNYLKSASYLLAGVAASRDQRVDLSRLSPQDVDEYVGFVVDRMLSSRRLLFGSPESCRDLLHDLHGAGVNEVACQLDFGPPADVVLENLPALDRLRQWAVGRGVPRHTPRARLAPSPGVAKARTQTEIDPIAAIRARCAEEHSSAEFYQRLAQWGIELGPSFQGIRRLWRRNGEALGEVELADHLAEDAAAYDLHPAYLDACLQLLFAALPLTGPGNADGSLCLPVGMRSFRVYRRPGEHVFSHAVVNSSPIADIIEGDVRLLDADGALLAQASGVRLCPVHGLAAATADHAGNIFYSLRWDPLGWLVASSAEAPQAGRWLVLANDGGVADALSPALSESGLEPVLVLPDRQYEAGSKAAPWRIRPGSPDDMRLLVEAMAAAGPWCGVIYLSGVEDGPDGTLSAAELSCGSVIRLVQNLARADFDVPPPVWLVTRGAQAVVPGDPVVAVGQAALWGLGRALAFEHPALWGGLVDLNPAASAAEIAAALRWAVEHRDEDEIAVRQDRLYAARLVQAETPPKAADFQCRPDAAYLITGGLGDLGLTVASWMADRGAQHLILLSRTGLPDRATWNTLEINSRVANQVAAVCSLETRGVEVITPRVDVADESVLQVCLAELTSAPRPPIRGVVHAAASVQGAILLNLDQAGLVEVLRPKMRGSWLLHRLTAGWDLDFFILFSAMPALFGWLGQGAANYAAANAFLDALAAHRRAAGQAALSIGWGPWGETGLARRTDGGLERLASQGVGALSTAEGCDALDLLLGSDRPHVAVAAIDWPQVLRVAPTLRRSPLLQELIARHPEWATDVRSSIIRDELLGLPAAAREARLSAYVLDKVADVLQIPPPRLDLDRPLSDVGLDSLMAIELKNRLEGELGVHVSMVTFLEGPSIRQLAAEVTRELGDAGVAPLAGEAMATRLEKDLMAAELDPRAAARMLANLDQMSDEEIAAAMIRLEGGRDGA